MRGERERERERESVCVSVCLSVCGVCVLCVSVCARARVPARPSSAPRIIVIVPTDKILRFINTLNYLCKLVSFAASKPLESVYISV